jgi:uncharacterized protein YpuA (DUF1002 family)
MMLTKTELKRIILEELSSELNKTIRSNQVETVSESSLGLLQMSLLRLKFAIVETCQEVNKEQNYNLTDDQIKELVDMLCERVLDLGKLNEEDYSRKEDDLKHRSEIDKANRKNLQKDKLQLQQKKIADKLRSI